MCASCAFVRTCVRSDVRACVSAWMRARCVRLRVARAHASICLSICLCLSLYHSISIYLGYKKAGTCAFIRFTKLSFDSCKCAVKTWWFHRADRCSVFIIIVPM